MTNNEMLASILASSEHARNNNEFCVQQFYLKKYGITRLDEVGKFGSPNYQTVLRMIRKLKEIRQELRGNNKDSEQDKYKEIALTIPYVERLF